LAKKYQVSLKEFTEKLGVMYLQSKYFALGWKHCCIVGLVKLMQIIWLTNQCIQHSRKSQSVRVTEKISFGFVGHHCRDITRSDDKCIFYLYI